MFRFLKFNISVEIPALDRLMDFLEGAQQAEIDVLTERVQQLTNELQQHTTGLETAMKKETL